MRIRWNIIRKYFNSENGTFFSRSMITLETFKRYGMALFESYIKSSNLRKNLTKLVIITQKLLQNES